MYLIKADQIDHLELEEVPSHNPPEHAILSHTWGDPSEEVLFEDIKAKTAASKPAYAKIRQTCEQAQKDGLNYVWVDSACIQRSNSVELQESLNSMFLWYHKSTKCYAYLVDVTDDNIENDPDNSQFAKSRWFTRGWTLQELLAPRDMVFFNRSW